MWYQRPGDKEELLHKETTLDDNSDGSETAQDNQNENENSNDGDPNEENTDQAASDVKVCKKSCASVM